MKPKSTLRSFLLIAGSSLLAATSLQAATYYWDTDGTTAGFGSASGTWGTSAFWSTNAAGTAATANSATATGDTINFGTSTLGLGAGTISVGTVNSGNINFGSLSGAIELTGGMITLAAAETITVNNASNTIGSALAGAATSLTKAGIGALTLNPSAVNTFTGPLIINGGTMALDYSNLATPADLLTSGKTLTLKGGNLTLKGKTGVGIATTQTLGNVTVNPYGATLLINPNGGDSTTLTLGTLDPTIVGSNLTLGTALGAGSGTVTIATTTNKKTDGSYGGRVVFANGAADTGYDWATTSSGGPSYTLEAYSGYTAMFTSGTDTANSRITASSTLSGALTTNSLKIENPAASQSLDLAGNTLTLTNGGLLVTGTNAFQINGSTGSKLIGLNGSGAFDLIVHQYNSAGLDIGVEISNNGATATALTKAGTGSLTLSGSNTFTGGLFINSGNVTLANAGALNNVAGSENAVALANGGNLSLNGNSVTVRMLNSSDTSLINGGTIQNANATPATLTVGNSLNLASTYSGVIQDGSGGGALTLTKSGTNTLTLSGTNTFTGGININAGTFAAAADANLGAASNVITFNNSASIALGSITYPRDITLNSGAIATFSNGGNPTISGNVTGTGGLAMTSPFGTQLVFSGPSNSFAGAINIGSTGVTGQAYRMAFASLADSPSANGKIIFSSNSVTHANGSVFEYTGSSNLVLDNRVIEITSSGATPANGHQIRRTGTGTLTVNTDLSVTSTTAQTLALNGGNTTGTNVFNGTISNGSSSAISLTKGDAGAWAISDATNSYTGTTRINGGTLIVNSLANGGVASSIGSAPSDAARLVLGGGTLKYEAINAVGGSGATIDRNFAIAASSSIDSSGSGALAFGQTGIISPDVTGLTGTTTAGSATVNLTVGTTADLVVGMTVSMTGVPAGRTVASINSPTQFTLSSGTSVTAGSNAASFGYPARTLTLTGTNTGANTIAGILQDSTAVATTALGLTKAGAGTWWLTNSNTYSGTTTVTNGVLVANSANAIPGGLAFGGTGSAININGGVLGLGAGDFTRLPSGVTVTAGKIAFAANGGFAAYGADRTVNFGGSSGVVGIGSTTTPNIGDLNGKTLILGAASATHKVTVTNTLDFGNSTRTIQVNDGAAAVDAEISGVLQGQAASTAAALTKTGTGTLVLSGANTYTGNTTVDAGTLVLADNAQLKFVLGATSGTNNSISGAGTVTLNGDFVIDTTAADALPSGSWTLENVSSLTGPYGSTFTVVGFTDAGGDKWTKVNGSKLYTFDETTGVITLADASAGYSSWASLNGAGPNLNDDHDNDGVSNGVEYFIGGPNGNTSGFTPLPGVVNNAGTLSVTFPKAADYAGVYGTDYEVEVSTTLGSWGPALGGSVTFPSATEVKYTFPAGTKNFARLKVTGP